MNITPPHIDLGIGKPPSQTRVVVAMSGGVDSSVSACLMVEAGYEVIGITLQLYDYGQVVQRKGACCAGQDVYDAAMVAEKMGFPHYVFDYEDKFKEGVIQDFVDTYLKGETPIPCVKCNQTVKFQDLLNAAKELNADVMVTGHYVQRIDTPNGPELHMGADEKKDQSYFLFATTKEQLDFLRFPLGGMSKEETREHALRFGLEIANKPDSQDICFVPNGDYASVIKKFEPKAAEPGNIVDLEGNVLGQHNGIIHYTVGQRRKLYIQSHIPKYVVKINAATKEVVVGDLEDLKKSKIYIEGVNWLSHSLASKEEPVQIKVRSARPPIPATLYLNEDRPYLELTEDEMGVSPGQACVFYRDAQVLGGGWIKEAI